MARDASGLRQIHLGLLAASLTALGFAAFPARGDDDPVTQSSRDLTASGRLSFAEVVRESLFGEASSDDWTPLSWRDILTEGWYQPFVFSPASDSGALRQEWIDSANGVFYRQWVMDYDYRNRIPSKGDQHLGSWFIFAPLNRRLEILFTVPFLDAVRLPTKATSAPGTGRLGSTSRTRLGPFQGQFGDLSVTPQILFHETRNTSVMGIMTITTPTGEVSGGNHNTTLGPQLQFWQGLPRQWVLRGSFGTTVPVAPSPSRTNLNYNLTVGKFLTGNDAKYLKEFTVYLAASASSLVDDRGPNTTAVTILPGLRFRVAEQLWFLYGAEFAPGDRSLENYTMFFRLVKRY